MSVLGCVPAAWSYGAGLPRSESLFLLLQHPVADPEQEFEQIVGQLEATVQPNLTSVDPLTVHGVPCAWEGQQYLLLNLR